MVTFGRSWPPRRDLCPTRACPPWRRYRLLPALSNRLILELKYRGAPPAIFRQLVEEFALTPQAASKYRLGMVALGQVVAEEIMTGTGTDSFYA